MTTAALGHILEKIASKDKDFRYMATSDLLNELENENFKADPETERKICAIVLQQLEDTSSDISGLAVKCLGLLVNRVAVFRVEEILQMLCQNLISGKREQQRDIAGIGLKTVIAGIKGGPLAAVVVKQVSPMMVQGVQKKEESFEICNESLDILHEVIRKFGMVMASEDVKNKTTQLASVLETLLPQMEEGRAGIRKRAIHCLAALSTYLPDKLLDQFCNTILTRLSDKSAKPDIAQAHLQIVGSICRAVGFRFGTHLDRAVPLAMDYCNTSGEEDYEIKEYCLQALESIVERCPQHARNFLEPIFSIALEFLSYDPNYEADMEEDEDEDEDMDDEDESEEEYSDDEDMSWKVRRAATKCLSAIVLNFPDLISDLYPKASSELISRFREREENVKVDIFHTFVNLIQVAASRPPHVDSTAQSPLTLIQVDTPAIMKATSRQLKEKSVKTKVGVFLVLRELVTAVPNSTEAQVDMLMPGVLHALQDKSSNSGLKIEALLFLKLAMLKSQPAVFQPHITILSKPVFAAVGDRYYKVTSEALRVCERMVHVISPDHAPASGKLQGVIQPLYQAVMIRLSAQDQDQEVKECAISCMATTVARLGSHLSEQLQQTLQVLLERLRNEITRLTAVKAFYTIASAPTSPDLSGVLSLVITELTGFLRKANRSLRQASLETLIALIKSQGEHVTPDGLEALMEETAALVSDADLHLAAMALNLCCTLLASQPVSTPIVVSKVLSQALNLVNSPLLQGVALEGLKQLFAALVCSGAPGTSCNELQAVLLDIGATPTTSKTAQSSVAQCVAILCLTAGPEQVTSTVNSLLCSLQASGDDARQRVSLLILGEVGRKTDLSSFQNLQPAINLALSSQLDEIKGAASRALGGITVGSLQTYLPFLLDQISTQQAAPKQQYLLLKALNEVISSVTKGSSTSGGVVLAQVEQERILDLLLANCESEEECRNVVAECAGQLAQLNPSLVLPKLQGLISSQSASMRWLVVTAVRYAVVEQPIGADAILVESLPVFLEKISDPDRHVRKAAVLTLSNVAHNKPNLIMAKLPGLLPALYQETVLREDLIRTVDLGPFKHKIDDGLELRKAAFECMDMVLDQCISCVDFAVFLQHLESGLKDHYDVKLPCHSMLTKLASVSPHTVLVTLDKLVEPLEKTLAVKLKSDAVKQEVDRNEDMLRSCLRAVDALTQIPAVDSCPGFTTFMNQTVLSGAMAAKYNAVKEERQEAEMSSNVAGH